jgi:hypothetical protein
MKICALYCVKNEIEFLPLSLATVLPFVDSVVIVNNRSTDGTVEFVNSLGDPKVQFFHMDTDFDEKCEFNVRNESLKFVPSDTDWILALDADQLLSDGWAQYARSILTDKTINCAAVNYEHFVGSYEHIDKSFWEKQHKLAEHPQVSLWVWTFFRNTPQLRSRPAAEVCSWARPQHHASFERSCSSGFVKLHNITLFHYGFSKRNMMEMSAYRIHRGDYGHEPERKAQVTKELLESGNPFKFVGPVHAVDYGSARVPSVMRGKWGHYLLELDEQGFIQSRRIAATGELAQ